MPRLLITLLIITALTFLLGRFSGKLFSRLTAKSKRADPGADLVQDPICGTYLSKKTAPETRKDGTTHYFCGRECAEAFEKRKEEMNNRG